MFLKSLSIKGFKSFAKKTVLEFEPGVTVVVGPNGSGKSNIADAVMWVLGEQSPTSLRGNRMEDVIFSGSSSLKPVSMAEVTLALDNSNNDFPLDYSEVTITRNVIRGGDSEYRLNNSSCRLLDIQELMSDAGVGRTLNSVISQGQLDDVLGCRPEERRAYIEEAGGLLKYRKRREKAVRKLERMDEELTRTGDVAREVRRMLRPLQRQAGRFERYAEVVRELKEARLRLDVAHLRALRREWEEHQARRAERLARLEAIDRALEELAGEAAKLEDEQSAWGTRERLARDELYRLVSLHETALATLTLWDEKAKRSLESSARGPAVDPAELEQVAARNAELERERESALESREEFRGKEAASLRLLGELNDRLNRVSRERSSVEARLEVMEAGLKETGLAGIVTQKRREIESLQQRHAETAAGVEAAEREVAGVLERLAEAESRLESLTRKKEEVLGSAGESEAAMASLSATLEILARLDTEVWSPANTSAELLKDDPTGGGLGLMLSSGIRVDPRYETAINSFIGPWLFGVMARDGEAIITAIKHLKELGLGQGLFFRRTERPASAKPARGVEGALAAREVVTAPPEFSDALDTLLDGVYLARDVDHAASLADASPAEVFLTPDGDVITGGTLVKGGSITVSPLAVEMQASRRAKLESDLAEARERAERLGLECGALGAGIDEARSEVSSTRNAAEEARLRRESLREDLAAVRATIDALERDLEEADARTSPDSLEPAVTELRKELADLEEARRAAARELASCEDARRAVVEGYREAAARLASIERRLEIGRIKERDMRARQPGGTAGPVQAIDEGELHMLMSLHQKLAGQLGDARKRAGTALEEGSGAEKRAAEGLQRLREEVARRQQEHERLRDLVHGEDLSSAELKIRVEQLVERVVDEHKVPLEFALKQYTDEGPTPDLEARVDELAVELERIGPVDPEAVAQRETLEERHEFLKAQIDDIEQARGQIKRVVGRIDREIEQKFVETLELVNAHFIRIFSSLFPNGRAELSLTDPEDVLNSGVEILAQPEGKRLRRISLLSGGETSMTALAFFFALFKVRPSPFYFLDEVEAALDDVNLHRFLRMVREFKSESQLVLITHQKRSMEIADLLYGITMQDDGMSRVVSQRLEAEKRDGSGEPEEQEERAS